MRITRREFGSVAAGAAAGLAMNEASAAQNRAQTFAAATDCHVHIIGPQAKYPMVEKRPYTPPQATVAQLKAMHERLGITRTVMVQPSFYGFDNSCMLDAMGAYGPNVRGVAVIAPNTPVETMRELDSKGVRGIRINLESAGIRDPKIAERAVRGFTQKVAPLKWHVQIYTQPTVIAQITNAIADSPVPIVVDHFGLPKAAEGAASKGFGAIIDLARAKKVYVKLSAPYRISKLPDYKDTTVIAQTLIYAARPQMLWASDWPHTQTIADRPVTQVTPFARIDDLSVFQLFLSYYPDEMTRRMILIDNPAKLYGFT